MKKYIVVCSAFMLMASSTFAGTFTIKNNRGEEVTKKVEQILIAQNYLTISNKSGGNCKISLVALKQMGLDPVTVGSVLKSNADSSISCTQVYGNHINDPDMIQIVF